MMQINSDKDLPLASEIYASSDRAAVILCMAWVDEQLAAAIQAVLLDDAGVFQKLFSPHGPMGSFAARCRLASLLGILMPETVGDLLEMAKLRNNAAHLRDDFSFADERIRSRVEGLRIVDRLWVDNHPEEQWRDTHRPPRPFDALSARMHFIRSASFAAANLYQFAQRADVRVLDRSLRPFF